jgi:uncharacterized protein DUF6457
MTAEEWIAAYAAELGVPAPADDDVQAMLRLASIAAHASERRAAPIACALAAAAGVPLDQAQAIAERIA